MRGGLGWLGFLAFLGAVCWGMLKALVQVVRVGSIAIVNLVDAIVRLVDGESKKPF